MDMNMKEYVNWKMSHDIKYGESEGYPLVLDPCRKNKDLKNFRVYGNSVQDGEPTPEAPCEVESVGELTKNLLPFKEGLNFTINRMKYSVKNGKFTVSGTCGEVYASNVAFKNNFSFTIKAGTYTFSYIGNDVGTVAIKNADTDETISSLNNNRMSTITFDNETNVYVGLYSYLFDSSIELECEIQLEEGSTATEYEPYHKYKIPVTVRGKNLLDVSRAGTKTVTVSGITVEPYGVNGFRVYGVPTTANNNIVFRNGSTTTRHRTYIKKDAVIKTSVHLDKTYNNVLPSGTRIKFQCSLYDKSWNWAINAQTSNVIKTPSDIYVIGYNTPQLVAIDTETYLDFVFYPQVEIVESSSSSATPYEPYIEPQTFNIYLDEPLRKVGDYADFVDFDEQKVARNVKNKVFTGEESMGSVGLSSTSNLYRYAMTISDMPNLFSERILRSNYFATGNYVDLRDNTSLTVGIMSTSRIAFSSTIATLPEFKNWIKDLYNSNPLYVCYPLKEPIEEPIELPELPKTQAKTMIYEVGTTIEPSNMYGKYVKKY